MSKETERLEELLKKRKATLKILQGQVTARQHKERALAQAEARKAEDRLKHCLGGAVLEAIGSGRLDKAMVISAITPGLRDQDHLALASLLTPTK
jgi:hypothetical protein